MAAHEIQIPLDNVARAQAMLPQNQPPLEEAADDIQVAQGQAVAQVVLDPQPPVPNITVAGAAAGEDVTLEVCFNLI